MRHRLAFAVVGMLALSGCLARPEGAESSMSEEDGTAMQEDGIVATLGAAGIDLTRTTHLVVIGYSHGQGTQFAMAAMARARRYLELYPDHQVVFFGAIEAGNGQTDSQVLKGLGAKVISDNVDEKFYDTVLLDRMRVFKAIASFDYYGHSSPWAIGVETSGPRLGTSSQADLTVVRGSFLPDAYATLNGCNAGRVMAPFLSHAWQIPVSGALTGSNFQALHSDGQWYSNDPGRAPSTQWAKTNSKSFSTPIACSKGGCLRLKPENAPYHGYWGDFDAGLGHYQFFCNYDGSEQDCSRRMASSLLSSVSIQPLTLASSRDEFESVVLDWLCPNDATSTRFNECKAMLREAASSSKGYTSFKGTPLECTDAGCAIEMNCDDDGTGSPKPGTCTDHVTGATSPMAQVREYQRYMAGFDALQGSEPGSGPTVPTSGPIDAATLEATAEFEVVASQLNCRETPYTGAVLQFFSAGTALIAQDSIDDRARVAADSRGKLWLLVSGEGSGTQCYVSAQYEYIRPRP